MLVVVVACCLIVFVCDTLDLMMLTSEKLSVFVCVTNYTCVSKLLVLYFMFSHVCVCVREPKEGLFVHMYALSKFILEHTQRGISGLSMFVTVLNNIHPSTVGGGGYRCCR